MFKFHLTRCLRTLRARLLCSLFSHSVAARARAKGSGQIHVQMLDEKVQQGAAAMQA